MKRPRCGVFLGERHDPSRPKTKKEATTEEKTSLKKIRKTAPPSQGRREKKAGTASSQVDFEKGKTWNERKNGRQHLLWKTLTKRFDEGKKDALTKENKKGAANMISQGGESPEICEGGGTGVRMDGQAHQGRKRYRQRTKI